MLVSMTIAAIAATCVIINEARGEVKFSANCCVEPAGQEFSLGLVQIREQSARPAAPCTTALCDAREVSLRSRNSAHVRGDARIRQSLTCH